ncbi:MAG: Lrp/AsnC family transcriptional regulator [Lachnospiraceae bacterium]|nr:Lrp/AsnC family transcriptional regulator [Lachnospiraceae bacterium]
MDENDKKIVNLLQDNARCSLKQLSEQVFLSSPAVAARIEKLEREGLITGYHASTDPEKMGYHITAYIDVEMPPKNKQPFVEYIREVPNVLSCDFVTGHFTMLVKAAFMTTNELDAFIEDLQRFGSTETHIVFSTPIPARGIRLPVREKTPAVPEG